MRRGLRRGCGCCVDAALLDHPIIQYCPSGEHVAVWDRLNKDLDGFQDPGDQRLVQRRWRVSSRSMLAHDGARISRRLVGIHSIPVARTAVGDQSEDVELR